MPVIVNAKAVHPFLPSLASRAAIEAARAATQDIRPLEILILNLMADKRATERQLALWLGHTPLQVNLTFAATDSYMQAIAQGRETHNTPTAHIRAFYNAFEEVRDKRFDGFVVTGVNALAPRVELEPIWPEVEEILAWSADNVFSSLFLCWGAKAALKHFYNIDSLRRDEKLWGVFDHTCPCDSTGLLFGFPDVFPMPVSRWKTPRRADIEACAALEILADSREAGPNILAEPARVAAQDHPYPRRVFVLSHPEYDTETLRIEYERDKATLPQGRVPAHYFPHDDPALMPRNSWRGTAHLYTNWIHALYEATPYDWTKR